MTFDDKGFSATHEEIIDMIGYYIKFQMSQGMLPYQANETGRHLSQFFQVAPSFAETVKCGACKGLGTNNLVKLGSKTPEPCGECKGSGRVKKTALAS